ncbi:MAG TPA: NADP-dependent oxidoreductase [Stackebrandtia sp.]|jgi:NADPH:quinone reductase-like Zn-dependent oxidoreductase|uniref:NADP-dependent oxidoreductase n=1 Tax=Stackebrandtia sp. TaxID=2023065 RepID=UPI002D22B984|nr:NADP-dependent oxidoreductase [Stackebrandtia sp.]HZE39397.1 NADP-dependent oxidoreductase [Stackebrandtia sp.]
MNQTMRAIVQTELGGPEVLTVADVPRPSPAPDEVLVRVRAAGVNPVDAGARAVGVFIGRPPFTVGWDVSGVVEEVGLGVTRLSVGDEVFGMPRFPNPAGGYGQYVTAPSRHFARKPASLSHVEAAGLPLVGLTAWQALVDTADVRPGQRVLVHAAAGGLGHIAVQIAKSLGAHVIGTASAAKHDFVRSLGADELIDYTSVDFTTAVEDVDVVVNSLSGEYVARSAAVLRRGGMVVNLKSADADAMPPEAVEREARMAFMLVEPDLRGLEELSRLVDGGELSIHVAETFDLEHAADAHRAIETGRTKGKIVLTVD